MKNKRLNWDIYFMLIVKAISSRSTCLSRKYGAIIVKDNRIISSGYNGSLPGQDHCSELGYCSKRKYNDFNYCKSPHAERNAIFNAAKMGISLEGSILYCSASPCVECLKGICMSGIKEVKYGSLYKPYNDVFLKDTKVNLEKIEINEKDMLDFIEYIKLDFDHKFL